MLTVFKKVENGNGCHNETGSNESSTKITLKGEDISEKEACKNIVLFLSRKIFPWIFNC